MAKELNSLYYRLRMIPAKIVQRMRYYKYKVYGYDVDITAQIERGVGLDRIELTLVVSILEVIR